MQDKHKAWMRFVKFCLVGVSNAAVYYFLYVGSLIFFRSHGLFGTLDYQVSQIIGFIVSVFWAFNFNRRFVFFESKESYISSLLKSYTTYAFTGFFINSALLFLWKNIGISDFIGPLINILFTTPVNYIMSKLWTFKK